MIILDASPGIKRQTGINFDVLGDVISILLMNNHRKPVDFVARIHKSKQPGVSQVIYTDEAKSGKSFVIQLDQSKHTRKFIFSSLLHELRHCCQLNIWKYWPDTCKFKTYEEYFTSKEERDARKAEDLTKIVMKMYDVAMEGNRQYRQFGLTRLGK